MSNEKETSSNQRGVGGNRTLTCYQLSYVALFLGWPFFVASERNITVNISEPLNISCHAQQSGDGEGVIHAVRWYRGCCNAGNDTLIPCTEGSLNSETDSIHVWSTNHGDLYFQVII